MADALEPWTHHEAVLNGVRLHWVEQGSGPLLVLLHGFPEFWWAWHRQIPALAAAGFRVAAPDLRGYNLSGKPEGVDAYRTSVLVDDVAALIRHLGAERAHVAGHDWGGVVAWNAAMRIPEMVDRLIVINAPHPAIFRRELKKPRQAFRSWYAAFFKLPAIPEAVFRARRWRVLRGIFRGSAARPDSFSREDVARYVEAASRPGALTAMLNYYRAFGRSSSRYGEPKGGPRRKTIDRPTLVIWGEKDQALNPHNLDGLEEYVPNVRIARLPEATHWVLADEPVRAAELMIAFLHERS